MKKTEETEFKPPLTIYRSSDEINLSFDSEVKNTSPKQYLYKYNNGIFKGTTVPYTESEIVRQLTNYWSEK